MPYLIVLFSLIAIYIFVIFTMKYLTNKLLTNIIFVGIITICYITFSTIVYLDVGPHDWNFTNILPTANISPFMFALTPLILLLPKQIKKYFFTLVSLLVVGMFLSVVFNCVYNTVINYKLHFHFVIDYVSHITISLWGIYLVKSKQVDLTIKNCLISTAIMLGIITIMLVINIIFDTSFFGLNLNGKHNIYNIVLVSNSYLSALIYYFAVVIVMFLGFIFQKLMLYKKNKVYQ